MSPILSRLSKREYQILAALSTGMLYKEIGHLHSISLNTVKKHLKSVYKKLEVSKRTHAVAIFKTTALSLEGMPIEQAETFSFRPANS